MVRSTSARPKVLPAGIDRGEEIIALGDEHPLVEMRAGREDLRDLALDELAGPGVFELLADGHLAAVLEDAGDVIVGGVKRQAAHGHAVAGGEGQIEDLRAGLGILEEQLVKIAQPEQQERVPGQFALDAAILRHHGGELGFGGHAAEKVTRMPDKIEQVLSKPRIDSPGEFGELYAHESDS